MRGKSEPCEVCQCGCGIPLEGRRANVRYATLDCKSRARSKGKAPAPRTDFCLCGCGVSLMGRRPGTMYSTPACKTKARWHIEKARLALRQRTSRPQDAESKKTPHAVRRLVVNHHAYSPGEAPHVPNILCKSCFGMPWARRNDREVSETSDAVVADYTGRCSGCGEAYAPEPRPEPISVLQSSAGMAARAAPFHGHTVEYKRTSRNQPRAAYKERGILPESKDQAAE